MTELLTSSELAKLNEIQQLIDEAYDDYIDRDPDLYHKSSEGHISVSFGNYFDRSHEESPRVTPEVEIYSYVLGLHRSHYFDSIDQALETVRVWHRNQLNTVYDADGGWFVNDEKPDPYLEIEDERTRQREAAMRELEELYGDPEVFSFEVGEF